MQSLALLPVVEFTNQVAAAAADTPVTSRITNCPLREIVSWRTGESIHQSPPFFRPWQFTDRPEAEAMRRGPHFRGARNLNSDLDSEKYRFTFSLRLRS